MQIIFDEKMVPELRSRYVVLELDTIMQPGMEKPLTLYALIETMNLEILTKLPEIVQQHEDMIRAYKSNDWDTAEREANALRGSWRGEIDEFYDILIESVKEMRTSNTIWTGVKFVTPAEE